MQNALPPKETAVVARAEIVDAPCPRHGGRERRTDRLAPLSTVTLVARRREAKGRFHP